MKTAGIQLGTWRRSRIGAFFAMLALAVQALLVQPHVDPTAAITQSHVAAPAISAPAEHGAPTCIICKEMALAGAMTLAANPTLVLASETFLETRSAPQSQPARTFPAHPWQSRGPPLN